MPTPEPCFSRGDRWDRLCPKCLGEARRNGSATRRGVRRECAWYRRRTREGVTVIHVLPRDLIDYDDVLCMLRSLSDGQFHSGVVVNLSKLSTLNSGLLAGLLTLQKRVASSGGKLAVCGARGMARRALAQTRLDTLFVQYRHESDAVAACRGETIA